MMVTTRRYLWIALFVVLQITVGICRSTDKPLNQDKGSTDNVKISDGSTLSNAVQNADAIPSVMLQDDLNGKFQHSSSYKIEKLTAINIIIMLTVIFFVLGSLIVGIIIMCCFPSKPKPGVVLRSDTLPHETAIQHAGNSN